MELWVRTQDKRRLLKPTDIGVGLCCGKYNVYDCEKSIGEYATEERCYEIIDEIQKILQYDGLLVLKDIDTSGMKKEDFEPFKAICYTSDSGKESELSFNQVGSYVYEMPQE